MMRLVVERGKLAGHGFDLERSVIVIGRGQDCDIILDEHQVSRQHARLQHTPQGWILLDLGSTNGTRVNGQPLRANEPYTLQPGDRIALGDSVFVLEHPRPAEAQPQKSQRRAKRQPVLLIAGAFVIVLVIVGIAVVLVLTLQDKEEDTAPGGGSPLDQIEEVLPIPTLIEGIATALPALPTQLEEVATTLPIPTSLDDLQTALPIPTQLEELVTALPIPLSMQDQPVATPPPPSGASLSSLAASASSQGNGQ